MQINLAKSAGFCFGVKRALDIALDTAKNKRQVFMLGDIVHNEDVVRQIQNAGIKKIKNLSNGKDKILLIRAHGEANKILKKALRLGYQIVDATCPMVKEIHRIAVEMENKDCAIIVIGDKKHDEVKGIIGHLKKKALVIEKLKDIKPETLKKVKKAAIVVQSTQNIATVNGIVKKLRKYISDLWFFNTICRPTRLKQEEIRKMPLENEVVIIIGSKNSANTKRLYEIAKSLNKRSYWISSISDIKGKWFKNAKRIGITAGASTPDSTTLSIINYLKTTFGN